MKSKRSIKKQINRMADELSGKAMLVGTLTDSDIEQIDSMVMLALDIQFNALSHINVSFDRTPRDFANGKEYRAARHAYYSKVYKAIRSELDTRLNEFVKQLNAMVPAELRESAIRVENA